VTSLAEKLDKLATLLELYPYTSKGKFKRKVKVVSHAEIQPALIICPDSIVCEDMACKPWALHQATKIADIPKVTLIKGVDAYRAIPVLTGECTRCGTLYSADHERFTEVVTSEERHNHRVYLNSAIYIKIGQSLWVDRVFSNAVVNGMYSFHGSASAYMEYWNNSFGVLSQDNPIKVS
jgi:hypothetical protein